MSGEDIMIKLTRRTALVSAIALAACSPTETKPAEPPAPPAPPPKPSEGKIAVEGGNVAWRRFGDGPKTPLLCLHGGPGVASDYLDPLGGLGDERAVYIYDQLGCGRSDRPTDAKLWTVDRFVAELATVRKELGLTQVHLLGQSWGSMLAVEYLLRNGEAGVKSAVLAGPVMSAARYAKDAKEMLKELTPEQRKAIADAEKSGKFDSPGYAAANETFMAAHLARSPTPETGPLLEKAMAGVNQDIYVLMNGPSEFSILGTLKDYDRVADLKKLSLPILFLSGEFDTATPGAAKDYAAAAQHAEAVTIAGAGHLTTIDQPQATNDAIRAFLHKVEG
jgi:proline iminopeptidase